MFCGTIELRKRQMEYVIAAGRSVLSSRLYRDIGRYQRSSDHGSCDHQILYSDGIDLLIDSMEAIGKSKTKRAVDCCQIIKDGDTLSRENLDFLRDMFENLTHHYLAKTDLLMFSM